MKVINDLIKLSNELDSLGFREEANSIDCLIKESVDGMDVFQGALDIAGFIPGAGEIFDVANATISMLRDDPVGAVLSTISVIPAVGDGVGKSIKAIRYAVKTGVTTIKWGAKAFTLQRLSEWVLGEINSNRAEINAAIRELDGRTGGVMFEQTWRTILNELSSISSAEGESHRRTASEDLERVDDLIRKVAQEYDTIRSIGPIDVAYYNDEEVYMGKLSDLEDIVGRFNVVQWFRPCEPIWSNENKLVYQPELEAQGSIKTSASWGCITVVLHKMDCGVYLLGDANDQNPPIIIWNDTSTNLEIEDRGASRFIDIPWMGGARPMDLYSSTGSTEEWEEIASYGADAQSYFSDVYTTARGIDACDVVDWERERRHPEPEPLRDPVYTDGPQSTYVESDPELFIFVTYGGTRQPLMQYQVYDNMSMYGDDQQAQDMEDIDRWDSLTDERQDELWNTYNAQAPEDALDQYE